MRASRPISRSSCRTPDSRVYPVITSDSASSVMVICAGRQPVLHELARNQVLPRDGLLLPLGIPGEVHHLHPVEQRARDVLDEIRGADEQHLAQIERHAEVVVHERVVLGRIEHLEQRARRVALERDAQLVHLVEQEHRVLGAGLLHPLDDPAGHGADVGAPVAPDVGLVARAAERDADVLPSHRPRDRLGDRGLSHARGAHEQQDRALRPACRPRCRAPACWARAPSPSRPARRGGVGDSAGSGSPPKPRPLPRRSSALRAASAPRPAAAAPPETPAPGPSRRPGRSDPLRGCGPPRADRDGPRSAGSTAAPRCSRGTCG